MIRYWAHVDQTDPEFLVAVARCESELKTTAVGDNGKAYGVYQFHQPTFEMFARMMREDGTIAKDVSLDYRDTEHNIRMASWAFSTERDWHWTCARNVSKV